VSIDIMRLSALVRNFYISVHREMPTLDLGEVYPQADESPLHTFMRFEKQSKTVAETLNGLPYSAEVEKLIEEAPKLAEEVAVVLEVVTDELIMLDSIAGSLMLKPQSIDEMSDLIINGPQTHVKKVLARTSSLEEALQLARESLEFLAKEYPHSKASAALIQLEVLELTMTLSEPRCDRIEE
jgi:hypothetical protein